MTRLNYEHGLHQTSSLADPYFSTIKRYANVVRQKTIKYERDDGGYWYGIATMDSTKFAYGPPGPGSALAAEEVEVAVEDEIVSQPAT